LGVLYKTTQRKKHSLGIHTGPLPNRLQRTARITPMRPSAPTNQSRGLPLPLLRGSPGVPGRRCPAGPRDGDRAPLREVRNCPGSREAREGQNPAPAGDPAERPFLGLLGPPAPDPRKRTYRAPARGVDVKPPSRRGPESPENGQNGHFYGKVGFYPYFGEKALFWAFLGFFDPSGVS